MVNTLHILTACSRPAGLPLIAASLCAAPIPVQWHVGFDLERRHVGGQAVKNALLDAVAGGWVWLCDDDNLPAPGFFEALAELLPLPDLDAILFGQTRRGRYAPPALGVGTVDAAQAVLRRETVGELRLPAIYEGDGVWIGAVCERARRVAYVHEALTTWNAQTEAARG